MSLTLAFAAADNSFEQVLEAIKIGKAHDDKSVLKTDITHFMEHHPVTENSAEAVRACTLEAEQGHPTAQFKLAWMYEKGRGGLIKDVAEAIK